MRLTEWPTQEKPREKLLQQGEAALSNAELIAIVLGCGSASKDVLSVSRDLLAHYQSLHALFHADQRSLRQHNGIGSAKSAQIKAISELNRRYLQEPLSHHSLLVNSTNVKEYLVYENIKTKLF